MYSFNPNARISSIFLCSFLVPKKVSKVSHLVVFFCYVTLFCNKTVDRTGVHKSFRYLANKMAACPFSRQGWRGLPHDHLSLVRNIVCPIRRRERWFLTNEMSSFASLIACDKKQNDFFILVISLDKSQYLKIKSQKDASNYVKPKLNYVRYICV